MTTVTLVVVVVVVIVVVVVVVVVVDVVVDVVVVGERGVGSNDSVVSGDNGGAYGVRCEVSVGSDDGIVSGYGTGRIYIDDGLVSDNFGGDKNDVVGGYCYAKKKS